MRSICEQERERDATLARFYQRPTRAGPPNWRILRDGLQLGCSGIFPENKSQAMQHASLYAEPIDGLICAVLRGESPPWPEGGGATHESFLRRSDYHGVSALLNEQLYRRKNWPADLREAIHDRAIAQAVWELHHQQVLTRVHAALAGIGLQPILLKGTALAYSLYLDPMLRVRGDTDMLIPSTERNRVHDVLTTLGFELGRGVSGEFVNYQASYMLALVVPLLSISCVSNHL
jgi:hypothetical protein